MVSELSICLHGTKHQMFHKWNIIHMWKGEKWLKKSQTPTLKHKTRLLQLLPAGSNANERSDVPEFAPKIIIGTLCGILPFRAKVDLEEFSNFARKFYLGIREAAIRQLVALKDPKCLLWAGNAVGLVGKGHSESISRMVVGQMKTIHVLNKTVLVHWKGQRSTNG